jgi:hypothetical protein
VVKVPDEPPRHATCSWADRELYVSACPNPRPSAAPRASPSATLADARPPTASAACRPAYQAQVFSPHDRRTIRKRFPSLAEARAWRADTKAALFGVGPDQVSSSSGRKPLLSQLLELGVERTHGPAELFGLEHEPIQHLGL